MENERGVRRSRHSAVVAATTVLALAATAGGWQPQTQLGDGRLAKPSPTPSELRLPPVDLVPVKVELPTAQFDGTPEDIRAPRVKPVQTKARPPFLAPAGTTNVALGKPVSSSDPEPVIGELAMVTDGDKEAGEGSFVELGPLLQHVTIDLQAEHVIYGIRLWHYHQLPRVYFDVVIQVANDPNFATDVQTVFNNDMDSSIGLGLGKDMHYVDTHFGELFDAKAIRGRYVRLYSRGNSTDDLNHYIEVEVHGKLVSKAPRLVPLSIQFPRQPCTDCFAHWRHVPYREDPPRKAPAPLMVPEGTRNVALGKPALASNPDLIMGRLELITDGDKDAREGHCAELDAGLQHITIDLQETHEIYAVAVWRWHWVPRVYFDVIVQIYGGPVKPCRTTTVYSSDLNNVAGFGFGQDKRYVDTNFGKVIGVESIRGRYVRLYSNGNSMNEFNHYVEVEVYGIPIEDTADRTKE